MIRNFFYGSSSNIIKDLPAGDEMSKLSDLSDNDMALDNTNYFEIFAPD